MSTVPIVIKGINPHEWKKDKVTGDKEKEWKTRHKGQYIAADCWRYNQGVSTICENLEIDSKYGSGNYKQYGIRLGSTDGLICEPDTCDSTMKVQDTCWVGIDNLKTYFGDTSGISSSNINYSGIINNINNENLKGCYPTVKIDSQFDIPNPKQNIFIDPYIPRTLKTYHDDGFINTDYYNEYMEDYCFTEVNTNCQNDSESCPRLFQEFKDKAGNNPFPICNAWGKENGELYDNLLNSYCSNNPKDKMCDCIAAPIPGSNYYELFDELLNVPELVGSRECWFKPCKKNQKVDNLTQKMQAAQPSCQAPKCVNFIDNRGSPFDSSTIKQYIDCTGDSSGNKPKLNIFIPIGIILLLLIAFLIIKKYRKK